MAEEQKTEENTAPEESRVSNAEIKNSELFQKLAGELNTLRQQMADEAAAKEQAQKEAELKQAQEKGDFEKALKMLTAEKEQMETQHKAEIVKRDITTELLKAGAKNSVFLNGAVAGYDGETDIAEYVSSLVSDDGNSVFFKSESSRQTHAAPPPVSQGGNKSWDQVKAMEKSTDPKQRAEAAKLIGDYMKANSGALPPGLE